MRWFSPNFVWAGLPNPHHPCSISNCLCFPIMLLCKDNQHRGDCPNLYTNRGVPSLNGSDYYAAAQPHIEAQSHMERKRNELPQL